MFNLRYCMSYLFSLLLATTSLYAASPKLHGLIGLIDKDLTLSVPGAFPGGFLSSCVTGEPINSIQKALSCLNDALISPTSTVTINVTQNNMNEGGKTITVAHPNGGRIHIIGNCGGTACMLHFSGGKYGFVVANHHTLGLLDHFTLSGNNQLTGSTGLFIVNNSLLINLKDINITNYEYGIFTSSGKIASSNNVTLTNNRVGISASQNGIVMAQGAHITHNTVAVYAEYGATIDLTGAMIANNSINGVSIQLGATANVSAVKSSSNKLGFAAGWNAAIYGAAISTDETPTACSAGGVIASINGRACIAYSNH